MTDWKAVGARIAERRELLDMTLDRLGEHVGGARDASQPMNAKTVWKHENGLRAMGDELLARFADALGVTEAWLRYGVVAMSEADREMIDRDAYRRGYEAAVEKARRALFRIGFTPAADSPMGRFLHMTRKEPP